MERGGRDKPIYPLTTHTHTQRHNTYAYVCMYINPCICTYIMGIMACRQINFQAGNGNCMHTHACIYRKFNKHKTRQAGNKICSNNNAGICTHLYIHAHIYTCMHTDACMQGWRLVKPWEAIDKQEQAQQQQQQQQQRKQEPGEQVGIR